MATLFLDNAPASLSEMTKRLSQYSVNALFIYEAACRLENLPLAERCRTQWCQEFQKRIEQTIYVRISSLMLVKHPDLTITNRSLDRLCSQLQIPNFAEHADFVKVCENLKPLAQLLLLQACTKKIETPQEAQPYIEWAYQFTSSASLEQRLVLYRLKQFVTECDLKKTFGIYVDKKKIDYVLNSAPNLTKLDCSGCTTLTADCFTTPHGALKRLILNGTSINPSEISNKRLFPQIALIENNALKEMLALDRELNLLTPQTDAAWISFKEKITSVEIVIATSGVRSIYRTLFERFFVNPTVEKWRAPKELYNYFEKIQNLRPLETDHFRMEFIDFCVKAWRELPLESWKAASSNDNDLGWKLTDYLIGTISSQWQQFTEIPPHRSAECTIWNAFEEFLANRRITTDPLNHKINNASTLNLPIDYVRTRRLLRSLRCLNGSFVERLLSAACDAHSSMREKLFWKQSAEAMGPSGRDALLDQIEFMTEEIVELSYQNLSSNSQKNILDLFEELLKVPSEVTRHTNSIDSPALMILALFTQKTHKAGPFYKEMTEHSIASALACNTPLIEQREKLLTEVLDLVANYTISGKFPLANCIVGNATIDDFPEYMRHSLLAEKLTKFKGVFEEEIAPRLKSLFFDSLIGQRLGNHDKRFVTALESLYKKDYAEKWRPKIKQTLRKIGGAGYDSLLFQKRVYFAHTANEVQEEARSALKRLGLH